MVAPSDEPLENNINQAAENQEKSESTELGEIEQVRKELKESQSKYLYLYAEFETYKKRVFKERSDLLKFGHESLVRELLQVADNLDRALQYPENHEALVSGIKMVNQQLKDTLTKFGITTIEAVGSKFDPEQHEAVSQEKIAAGNSDQVDGQVIREHQKGYMLHGRLLRPARVVVATK